MSFNEDWEREAVNWAAWARTPGHDAYWYYSPSFFAEIVPEPGHRTVEIGCGEGRVTRDLKARGHQVAAIDASPTLVRLAEEADPAGEYRVADAAALPFPDASFDLAVAYNSLMDVQDMPGAVREAGRVLEPGGRFCICVTHPLLDAGRWTSQDEDAHFVIEDSYFGRRRFEGTFEKRGLEITFRGWCYPLEDYARALEDAGFLIERIREPVAMEEEDPRHARVPLFLQLRAVKR